MGSSLIHYWQVPEVHLPVSLGPDGSEILNLKEFVLKYVTLHILWLHDPDRTPVDFFHLHACPESVTYCCMTGLVIASA